MINYNFAEYYEEDVAEANPMMDNQDFDNPESPAESEGMEEDMPTSVRILSIIS